MKKIKNIVLCVVFAVVMVFAGSFFFDFDEEIDSSDLEIEKKWLTLVADIPYDLEKADEYEIEQTYLSFAPEMRIRKINGGSWYTFTLKRDTAELGLTRKEYEIVITKEEYNNLLKKQEGNTIYKTRYQMKNEDGMTMCFDIFSGDLTGLAYMEIEFESESAAESYGNPKWVKKDITRDLNYKNGYLARYGIPQSYDEDIK